MEESSDVPRAEMECCSLTHRRNIQSFPLLLQSRRIERVSIQDHNLITTMAMQTGTIDRQKTVPFHLKLFYKTGGFRRCV